MCEEGRRAQIAFSPSFMRFRKYKHLQKRHTSQPNPFPPSQNKEALETQGICCSPFTCTQFSAGIYHSCGYHSTSQSLNFYSTSVRQPEQVHIVQ